MGKPKNMEATVRRFFLWLLSWDPRLWFWAKDTSVFQETWNYGSDTVDAPPGTPEPPTGVP